MVGEAWSVEVVSGQEVKWGTSRSRRNVSIPTQSRIWPSHFCFEIERPGDQVVLKHNADFEIPFEPFLTGS